MIFFRISVADALQRLQLRLGGRVQVGLFGSRGRRSVAGVLDGVLSIVVTGALTGGVVDTAVFTVTSPLTLSYVDPVTPAFTRSSTAL